MPLEAVDGDPFAAAAGPQLVPVDGDPFAAAPQAAAPKKPLPRWGTIEQLMNGATFGTLPNILAGTGAIAGLVNGKGPVQGYKDSLQGELGARDAYRQESPIGSTVSDIAGGVVTGGTMAKLGLTLARPGMGLAKRIGAGAVEGAGLGALAGVANGQNEDPVAGGIGGLLFGGGAGAAVPLAGAAVRSVTDPIGKGIRAIRKPFESAQDQVVEKGLGPAGKTPQQVADDMIANQALGKGDYAVVDAGGYSTARVGSTVAKNPGTGREEIGSFVEQRANEAGGRIKGDVRRGIGSGDALATDDALIAARKANARADYNAAYAGPTPDSPALTRALGLPSVQRAMKLVNRMAAEEQVPITQVLTTNAAGDTVPTVRGWDMIKRHLDAQVSTAYSSGNSANAALATGVKQTRDQVREALAASNPDYRRALSNFRSAQESREALQLGRDLITKGDADAAAQAFRRMDPGERHFARIGAAREIMGDIDGTRFGQQPVNKVAGTPDQVARIRGLFDNPSGPEATEFAAQMAAERTMARTNTRLLSGSQTAQNLADDANLGGLAHLRSQGADGIIGRVLNFVGSKLSGLTEESAHEIAKILTSRDPNVAVGLNAALSRAEQRKLAAMMQEAGFMRGIAPLGAGAVSGSGDRKGQQ